VSLFRFLMTSVLLVSSLHFLAVWMKKTDRKAGHLRAKEDIRTRTCFAGKLVRHFFPALADGRLVVSFVASSRIRTGTDRRFQITKR